MAENEENENGGSALEDLNFNVDDEYKPDPLIPRSTYHGVVNSVKFEPAQSAIMWDFCLHDNGGVMNDDSTPVDGAHVFFRNWLPRAGDSETMTKNGKTTKRQSKINQLQNFQEVLGIDMSTPQKIATAIAESQWVGIEADLDVDIDSYQGRFRNVVNKVRKSSMF